jgi:ankyrin repeat protein
MEATILSNEALIQAVKDGDRQKVETELASGADVNASGPEQEWTPLNYASGKGDLVMVELLVKKGANVFKTGRDNRTPYQIAVAAGHAAVARYLAAAEAAAGGDSQKISSRQSETRPYCKAYYLKDLRRFASWSESRPNGKADEGSSSSAPLTDDDVVFVHQDLTVTQSMFHNENVIMGTVTPQWRAFCANELGFKVPDDFDLMPTKSA